MSVKNGDTNIFPSNNFNDKFYAVNIENRFANFKL